MTHLLTFTPPPLKRIQQGLWLQQQWFDPIFTGLDNVDKSKPALYVGNHTLYGTLDAPLMLLGLYQHKDIFLRSLGDHIHFKIPLWRNLLWDNGCVQAKEHILVFPGGGREVMKNKGEEYKLVWKERTGFARMAMEHGYDIIPFASVGADEIFDIRYDTNDFYQSKLGQLVQKTGIKDKYLRGGDAFLPFATGLGLLPRSEILFCFWGEN